MFLINVTDGKRSFSFYPDNNNGLSLETLIGAFPGATGLISLAHEPQDLFLMYLCFLL